MFVRPYNLRIIVDSSAFYTVELRFDEVPRDWENWFVKWKVRCIEDLSSLIFYCVLNSLG